MSPSTLISVTISITCMIAALLPTHVRAVEWKELIVNDEEIASQWGQASIEFDNLIFSQRMTIVRKLDDIVANSSSIGLTKSCTASVRTLSKGLKERKIWAYQFMDSSGKGKSGFTYGYISDFGNFDQCIGLTVPTEDRSREAFHGKYCMVNVRFPLTRRPERNFLRVSVQLTMLFLASF